jgi:hypothetical protein
MRVSTLKMEAVYLSDTLVSEPRMPQYESSLPYKPQISCGKRMFKKIKKFYDLSRFVNNFGSKI